MQNNYTPPEPLPSFEGNNRDRKDRKYFIQGVSLFLLLVLIAFFIAFVNGWYGLYAIGLISLGAIPIVLIGGAIFTVSKKRWFTFGLGFIFLPISWVITLIGSMSDPPFDPANVSMHMIHAAVLLSGFFACWLFLTLIFWPRQS